MQVTLRHFSEAGDLIRELPAHLLMPPVWQAPLPSSHNVAWADGYQRARQSTLPRGGVFTPARLLCPDAILSPYQSPGERDAFRAGLAHYLSELSALIARHQPQTSTPTIPTATSVGQAS